MGADDQVQELSAEAPVEGCSGRRHGRFIVSEVSGPSPCKPPPGPMRSSPMASPAAQFVSERRPSRIIGRFEVSQLFPDKTVSASVSTSAAMSATVSPSPTPGMNSPQ